MSIILLDGAMGTTIDFELKNTIKCKEKINEENPEIIKKIHKKFIESGSEFIRGNTFNCSKASLENYGEDPEKSYIYALKGAKIVKEICDRYGKKSIGVFCLPGKEQILGIIDGNIDFIMIETIFDLKIGLESLKILKEELNSKKLKKPLMFSFTVGKDGKIFSGEKLEDIIELFICDDTYSVGINCSCVLDELEDIFIKLKEKISPRVKLSFYGNINEGEERYLNSVKKLVEKNLVDIVGGCCGTKYEHIKKINEIIKIK